MDTWECIDHERVPGDEGVVYLMNRGDEYAIHVDGRELMASGPHGSEDALANLACDRLTQLQDARILVGGLGMGFTLAAALRRVGPEGNVTVAELMASVARWNEQYLGRASGLPLKDPRSSLHLGDVGDLVETPPAPWSAILLDVDNGPDALTHSQNAWLYRPEGLCAAREALIPGGILGIWSAWPDSSFTQRLIDAGFETEEVPFLEDERLTPDNDGMHMLWMARRVS